MPAGYINFVDAFGMAAKIGSIAFETNAPPLFFPYFPFFNHPVTFVMAHTGQVFATGLVHMPVPGAKMLTTIQTLLRYKLAAANRQQALFAM